MTQEVRIYFIGGQYLDIDWDTWINIEKANLGQFFQGHRAINFAALNPNNITHVMFLDETPATSEVITPPKPAEIRHEKEREEELTDRSLDAQLSNPDLGNE